jgi:hypothetical protein
MKMPYKMSINTLVTILESCFTVLVPNYETTGTHYDSHTCAHDYVFYLQLHTHIYPV